MKLPLLPLRESFSIPPSHHSVSFPYIKPHFWCRFLFWGVTLFSTSCFPGFLAGNGYLKLLRADLLWPIKSDRNDHSLCRTSGRVSI